MVGLAGVVATQRKDINVRELLSRMCEAIRHEERHKIELYASRGTGLGRAHLGIFNPQPQPIFNEDSTICIMMDGEIYDYQDLKEELVSKGHTFSIDNDPEFILHLYEEYGSNFVHKLNGSFSLIIWNEKSQKLLIASDRYGSRPVYYTNRNGYLLFGSEVKAILQDRTFKKTVDDRSVAEFFSFGYILGNKTFFRGIELLPPASIMTYAADEISIEQYWDFDFNKKYEDHPEEFYIEKLSGLISQAVERQMNGNHRIGALLSGGLDSRTIVASIHKRHYPIHTFTHGRPGCNDARFAQMIADKLGTNHHFFEFKPDDMVSQAERMVYITDGMLNVIHAQRMQTYSEIAGYIDVVLHGWIGDATTGAFLEGLLANLINIERDNVKIFKRVCDYMPVDLPGALFNSSYFPLVKENLEFSEKYISRTGENVKLPSNRLMYYNFKERNRRLISTGFIFMRNFLEVRIPFSDYDYVDFIFNIPPAFKIDQMLYKKMILAAFPHLRNVPSQATGVPLYKSNLRIQLSLFSKQMINKAVKKIRKSVLFSDGDVHLVDYGRWMRTDKKLKDYILSILLDQRTLGRPYFNAEYIKKIVDSHMKGEEDYSVLIGLLLTFELWNRQFMDK